MVKKLLLKTQLRGRTDLVIVSDYPLNDPEGSVIGRYLAGEEVAVPHTRQVLESGRPVYAPGKGWACDLAGAGFGVEPYTEELFRVWPMGDPDSGPATRDFRARCTSG